MNKEKPLKYTKKLCVTDKNIQKFAWYNIIKSVVFVFIDNKWSQNEIKKAIIFIIISQILQYLGEI